MLTSQIDMVCEDRVLAIFNGTSIRADSSISVSKMGRTEDLRFSPDRTRLAVVSFNHHKIFIFEISLMNQGSTKYLKINDYVEYKSAAFKYPHGMVWIDDNTIAVTSRGGKTDLFKLPSRSSVHQQAELKSITSFGIVRAPSSITVRKSQNILQLLIVSNPANSITISDLSLSNMKVTKERVFLKHHLNLPDGIALSSDSKFIAVSNHNGHNILIYEYSDDLNESSNPVAILNGVGYPHGLVFNGTSLLVTDAGSPFISVYESNNGIWSNQDDSAFKIQMMSDEAFKLGNISVHEGGFKGIDIVSEWQIAAVTCSNCPLAFYDLSQ